MKLLAATLSLALASCVASPYYGKPILTNADGVRVCGLHGTKLKKHTGYSFNGFISPSEDDYFSEHRYPNTLSVGFSKEYSGDETWPYTIPTTAYTCEDCYAGRERLSKLPMWYKKIIARPAELRREWQLKAAARKAHRTGNPKDAELPEGNGTRSVYVPRDQ